MTCLTSEEFRESVMRAYEWDGVCPYGQTAETAPHISPAHKSLDPRKSKSEKPGGCARKHCRLGDRECDQYWGCRDTCRVVSERITSMEACPQLEG